jgi:hypothetical protein
MTITDVIYTESLECKKAMIQMFAECNSEVGLLSDKVESDPSQIRTDGRLTEADSIRSDTTQSARGYPRIGLPELAGACER